MPHKNPTFKDVVVIMTQTQMNNSSLNSMTRRYTFIILTVNCYCYYQTWLATYKPTFLWIGVGSL